MMKKNYKTPEAEKISFNYRDQVAAASAGTGESDSSNSGFMQNSAGIGSPLCGSGGIVDIVFDYAGSSMCA